MTPPTLLFQGAMRRDSSFALINRRLVAGLRRNGWATTVFATDADVWSRRMAQPDVYLFHDYPYDLRHAPGRINAFILNYDYARFVAADRLLAVRLNGQFDLLFVPSRFVARVCRRNGVRIPIHVCPWAVDRRDIHPGRAHLPSHADVPFRFLYLGGATERKGCDLLLRAYRRAFTDEAVTLTVKAFSYNHLVAWMEEQLAFARGGRHLPPVTFEHRTVRSVGPYYRAADAGVFPFRGEAFGLPILECLASGTPVIVTRGGGPLDYCRAPFATFVRTTHVVRHGKHQLEADVDDLARLMRESFLRGRPNPAARAAIAASVAAFTWKRTIDTIDRALRSRKPLQPSRALKPPTDRSRWTVAYAHFAKGRTSWLYTSRKIEMCLERRYRHYLPLPFVAPRTNRSVDLVVGQSGYCLERFQDARRANPSCRTVLLRESAPFEVVAALENRERSLLGLAALPPAPIQQWTHRRESEIADRIVLLSTASRVQFMRAGYPEAKLRVVPPGITVGRRLPLRRAARLRFLFVGTDALRKGVRVLLDAWERLQIRGAELLIVANQRFLQSPRVVRLLVRNPTITVRPLISRARFVRVYADIDCQVLPTLEDGFSMTFAEGMGLGRPGIVSRAAGVSELIEHGENGLIVRTGSVDSLAESIQWVFDNRGRLPDMGDAAYETARRHPWRDFQREFVRSVEEP